MSGGSECGWGWFDGLTMSGGSECGWGWFDGLTMSGGSECGWGWIEGEKHALFLVRFPCRGEAQLTEIALEDGVARCDTKQEPSQG